MYIPQYFNESGPILLVDDTPDNLRLLSKILESKGFKVRKTVSGKMAIQAAQIEPPDLILLDINMPEINGYEVCRRLKLQEKTAHIPIIFISALDQAIDKVKAFEIGGVDYITKPFQEAEVLARVTHQLIIYHQQQQLQTQNQKLQQEVRQRQQVEANLKKIQRVYEEKIVELTNQIQRSLELVDKMQLIIAKLHDGLAEPDIWQLVVQELAVSLQLEGCFLTICEPEFQNCAIAHQYGKVAHLITLLVKSVKFYQQLLPEHITQFCCWEPNSTRERERQQTILIYSIFNTHGILGHLWLLRQDAEMFSEWEIRLVKQVVYHCALALRQARLYQATSSVVGECLL
jgi:DNA-binding response OmpR family regulator